MRGKNAHTTEIGVSARLIVLGLAVWVVGLHLADVWRQWRVPRLSPIVPGTLACKQEAVDTAVHPLVSVIIPARNEALTIAQCLSGVLAQDYSAIEILVLDDRSEDATPQILAAYMPHVSVVQGVALPVGWAGKCFACFQAAQQARGEWLLFLDADTIPQPGLVHALVSYAEESGTDLVSLFPLLHLPSWYERLVLPPFIHLMCAIFPLERMSVPGVLNDEILANGQCMLVRRSAYSQLGGHAAVRASILEDVDLARAMHAAGFQVRTLEGPDLLHVRMYRSAAALIEGLAKNATFGAWSGGKRTGRVALGVYLNALIPLWITVYGIAQRQRKIKRIGLTAFALCTLLRGVLIQQRYRLSVVNGILWLPGLIVYGLIALYGWLRLVTGRGVRWKGRSYRAQA